MHIRACPVAAAVVLLAGCSGCERQIPGTLVSPPSHSSDVEIYGDTSEPVNKLAIEAIADLQDYWAREYPKLYGVDYEPVSGGFFAVIPSAGDLPPCASDPREVAGNAFYCSAEDVVAWDAEGLLPALRARFGDFTIPVVMAHEWGHAVQARSHFTARTVTRELQADCFVGAWARHAQEDDIFDVSAADLDKALAGVLELRDTPGTSRIDPEAHGSGFDRVSAFQDGFDNGLERCKDYRDDNPVVLALPFSTVEDAARRGDAPYESIVNGVPYDLEDYWTYVYPELTNGRAWPPVSGLEPFDPSNPPICGNQSAEDYALFYCVPDDYIGWDDFVTMPKVYDLAGDYAVAALLATQYGLAALERLGDESDEKTSTLRADCLAGAYTASVILYNRSATSTYRISPGDLDEAIKALLVFRGEGDVERQGAGFARVRAFREGVMDGARPCLDYQA